MVTNDLPVGDPQCEALTMRGKRCRKQGERRTDVGGRLALLCAAHQRLARHELVPLVAVDDNTTDEQRRSRLGRVGQG